MYWRSGFTGDAENMMSTTTTVIGAVLLALLSLQLHASDELPAWVAKIRPDHPRLFFNAREKLIDCRRISDIAGHVACQPPVLGDIPESILASGAYEQTMAVRGKRARHRRADPGACTCYDYCVGRIGHRQRLCWSDFLAQHRITWEA